MGILCLHLQGNDALNILYKRYCSRGVFTLSLLFRWRRRKKRDMFDRRALLLCLTLSVLVEFGAAHHHHSIGNAAITSYSCSVLHNCPRQKGCVMHNELYIFAICKFLLFLHQRTIQATSRNYLKYWSARLDSGCPRSRERSITENRTTASKMLESARWNASQNGSVLCEIAYWWTKWQTRPVCVHSVVEYACHLLENLPTYVVIPLVKP
jgi:hypothetical protein